MWENAETYITILLMTTAWIICSVGALSLLNHLKFKVQKSFKIVLAFFGIVSLLVMVNAFLIVCCIELINDTE
jgi:hypothetical protein